MGGPPAWRKYHHAASPQPMTATAATATMARVGRLRLGAGVGGRGMTFFRVREAM
jgi:hypothetical protein